MVNTPESPPEEALVLAGQADGVHWSLHEMGTANWQTLAGPGSPESRAGQGLLPVWGGALGGRDEEERVPGEILRMGIVKARRWRSWKEAGEEGEAREEVAETGPDAGFGGRHVASEAARPQLRTREPLGRWVARSDPGARRPTHTQTRAPSPTPTSLSRSHPETRSPVAPPGRAAGNPAPAPTSVRHARQLPGRTLAPSSLAQACGAHAPTCSHHPGRRVPGAVQGEHLHMHLQLGRPDTILYLRKVRLREGKGLAPGHTARAVRLPGPLRAPTPGAHLGTSALPSPAEKAVSYLQGQVLPAID